jgi:hypothetical protein
MTIFRHYSLTAAEGKTEALHAARLSLAAAVRPLSGCQGLELYRDPDHAGLFFFVERSMLVSVNRSASAHAAIVCASRFCINLMAVEQ